MLFDVIFDKIMSLSKEGKMDNFLFWFIFAIILLICIVVPVAVTQIAEIGWILGKNGDEEE